MESKEEKGITRRSLIKGAGIAALTMGFFGPRGRESLAAEPIKIGQITPQTGFLAQMGWYANHGATLAVDEANAAGGVLGRQVELILEDEVNPGVAVQKARKLIEKDKVHAIQGTVSSACALAVGDVVQRAKIILVNTGSNSDEIRNNRCHRYVFSTEGCNTQYVSTIGDWLIKNRKFNRWYFITSDYAFGHDLLRVSRNLLRRYKGEELGSELVPTGTTDFSSYLLKIGNAKPDTVFQNLAGTDQTNFFKQYREYGLPFPLAGGVCDTAPAWQAGVGNVLGMFPLLWYHTINKESLAWAEKFKKLYGKLPENQAWSDYVGTQCILGAIAKAGSTNGVKIGRALEGFKINCLKGRELYLREWDHELMQPMYVVRGKTRKESSDKEYDIFQVMEEVPAKNEPLTAIAIPESENVCKMEPW
jgi:branched-chain amino acid transport system substrate-binding protein